MSTILFRFLVLITSTLKETSEKFLLQAPLIGMRVVDFP